MAGELTKEQRAMVDACLQGDFAWTTATGSENDALLRGWADLGWVVATDAPTALYDAGCTAYRFTDKGRLALSESREARTNG